MRISLAILKVLSHTRNMVNALKLIPFAALAGLALSFVVVGVL